MDTGASDLAARGAQLEYWFWAVRNPKAGAIIDLIVRRATGLATVRVSTWVPAVRPVIQESTADWVAGPEGVRIGSARLGHRGSSGAAGDVAWEVAWDLDEHRLAPRPDWMGPLHPFDMELLGRPRAHITGSLTIAGDVTTLDTPGTVTHYWGRRLPDRWTWISAPAADGDPASGLEAYVGSSRAWGHGPPMRVGYLWLLEDGRVEQTVLPVTGWISNSTDGPSARIRSVRLDGRRHTIASSAPIGTFNDAGEGIRQSAAADLVLDSRALASGTALLEFRGDSTGR